MASIWTRPAWASPMVWGQDALALRSAGGLGACRTGKHEQSQGQESHDAVLVSLRIRGKHRPMELDDPGVIAEARAVFDRYEDALMNNRTEVLDSIFWADPRTVRFGVTEILYGIDAIRAFRNSVKAYAQRVQRKVHITSFGSDFACTHLEYERVGTGLIGRETKIMVRLPETGWRVVSAHVSLLASQDPGRQ